MKLGELSHGVF